MEWACGPNPQDWSPADTPRSSRQPVEQAQSGVRQHQPPTEAGGPEGTAHPPSAQRGSPDSVPSHHRMIHLLTWWLCEVLFVLGQGLSQGSQLSLVPSPLYL